MVLSWNDGRLATALIGAMLAAIPLGAEDKKKEPGLYATGDLTYLWTSGNSKANSFGLKLDLARLWTKQTFRLSGGGLRQASSEGRIAVGTPTDYALEVAPPACISGSTTSRRSSSSPSSCPRDSQRV